MLLAALVQGWLRLNRMVAVEGHVEDGCDHENQGGDNGDRLGAAADQHDLIWMQGLTRRKLDSREKRRGQGR